MNLHTSLFHTLGSSFRVLSQLVTGQSLGVLQAWPAELCFMILSHNGLLCSLVTRFSFCFDRDLLKVLSVGLAEGPALFTRKQARCE